MHVENLIILNMLRGDQEDECASHLHRSYLLIYCSLDLTPFEAVAYRPSLWTFIYLPPLCIVGATTMCVSIVIYNHLSFNFLGGGVLIFQ